MRALRRAWFEASQCRLGFGSHGRLWLFGREFSRDFCYHDRTMVKLNAHFDGKVFVPDEPPALRPNQKVRISVEPIDQGPTFTPHTDFTAALMTGGTWDEMDAMQIDPMDATPADFVRKPGSGAGEIKMSDDFDDTPDDFKS